MKERSWPTEVKSDTFRWVGLTWQYWSNQRDEPLAGEHEVFLDLWRERRVIGIPSVSVTEGTRHEAP